MFLDLDEVFSFDDIALESHHVPGFERGSVVKDAEDAAEDQGDGGEEGGAERNVRVDA